MADSETLFTILRTGQEMEGTIALFGFPSTKAELVVLPRSKAWRAGWASGACGAGVLLAPLAGLIPPHAPWVVASLGIGGFLGWRRWRERFTILSLRGLCPRCGGALTLPSGTPLRPVMTLPCQRCHHDSSLTVAVPEGHVPDVEQA